MKNKMIHILSQRVLNVPLAIHPKKAEVILSSLSERFNIGQLNHQAISFDYDEHDEEDPRSSKKPYEVIKGVAIIPIYGTLVQKLGTLEPYSGMTGYDGIRINFLNAMHDSDVKAICLDIDSPGGEVAGCFDLVDCIYSYKGTKPVWSILSENAFSAAYAIASAADKITVPRSGGVGSIGVITLHCDYSERINKDGLNVTIINFGDRKADGNPYEKLGEQAKKNIQSDIDELGQLFVGTVARNRNLNCDVVISTQAGCYMGHHGVSIGLADAVLSPNEAFQKLLQEIN
ncbi:S49 family peptidase (plasmid) [Orbus sturtevantii]|uniref:S49 family peptidase n=1 Tax=Orbus sturtevantii TaxID=3074109 RepID=UPI00370DC97B